jgi:UDPglucose 6-dehydrogenase
LTGSGTSAKDLHIFEVGSDVEDTFVDISSDGIVWHSVGKVYGAISSIDIDAFGFGVSDAFTYVRLTDDPNEGAKTGTTVGADIDSVLEGVGSDSRIGNQILRPGPGWGGSCFPKDTRALISMAQTSGSSMPLVEAAVISNEGAFERVVRQTELFLEGSLDSKTIAVWGLAFKANTDDTRDRPALEIISRLISKGAKIRAFDPVASIEETPSLALCDTALEAATGSHAVLVLTEWSEFSDLDAESTKQVMAGDVIFDTRNVLDDESWGIVFAKFRQLGRALG